MAAILAHAHSKSGGSAARSLPYKLLRCTNIANKGEGLSISRFYGVLTLRCLKQNTIFGRSRRYCAMAAPNSAERKACWNARDELWKCLDDHDDNALSCQKFQSQFEGSCPAQWVKYFIKRREFLKYKARMETEGFSPAEGPKQPS